MPKPRSCLIWAKKREKRGCGSGASAVTTDATMDNGTVYVGRSVVGGGAFLAVLGRTALEQLCATTADASGLAVHAHISNGAAAREPGVIQPGACVAPSRV